MTRSSIEPIAYADNRPPVEVLTLATLHARAPRVLTLPERPAFHLLLLPTRGAGWHTVDFVRHPLEPGVVLTVAAGQVQQFALAGALDAWLIVLRPEAVRWAPNPLMPLLRLDPARHALVTDLVMALVRALALEGGVDVALRLIEAIGAVLTPTAAPVGEGAALVARLRARIEQERGRLREVEVAAVALHTTPKTLTRHCLASTGRTPKALLDAGALLAAQRELAHGNSNINELSDALGFPSTSQFVRFFRRLSGETPEVFRLRVQGST